MLMKATIGSHKAGDMCAGFQLLKYRSNKSIQSNHMDLTLVGKQTEDNWQQLKQLSLSRSISKNVSSTPCENTECCRLLKRRQVTPSHPDGIIATAQTLLSLSWKTTGKSTPVSAHRQRKLL
jgi:hypothetical protein